MQSRIKGNINLKDGIYKGIWSGFTVKIIGDMKNTYKTIYGIKNNNVKCVVNIQNRIGIVSTYGNYDRKLKKMTK